MSTIPKTLAQMRMIVILYHLHKKWFIYVVDLKYTNIYLKYLVLYHQVLCEVDPQVAPCGPYIP